MPFKQAIPLPASVDPKNASVLDPLWQAVARKLVGWSGADDPTQMLGVAGPLTPTPLVSIYKDKAAREAGGKIFQGLVDQLPGQFKQAFTKFGTEYPRIAAHIEPLRGYGTHSTAQAFASVPEGKVMNQIPVIITGRGIDSVAGMAPADATKEATRIAFHEGAHVAQALGNSDMRELYHLSNVVRPYPESAFERTAENAGIMGASPAKLPGMTASGRRYKLLNAIDGLKTDANKVLATESTSIPYPFMSKVAKETVAQAEGRLAEKKAAAEEIMKMLKFREQSGWKPSGQLNLPLTTQLKE